MARRLSVWSRIAYVFDAFSLVKLAGAAVLFVLWHGSPLFALGIVFAAPVIAVGGLLILRLLRQAGNGERVDYSLLGSSQTWRRERPPPRRFATSHVDVTPIKYRQIRTSTHHR